LPGQIKTQQLGFHGKLVVCGAFGSGRPQGQFFWKNTSNIHTLQGINISHLGKFGKSSSKCHFFGGYVIVPWRVHSSTFQKVLFELTQGMVFFGIPWKIHSETPWKEDPGRRTDSTTQPTTG